MNTIADVMARLAVVLGDTAEEATAHGFTARLKTVATDDWGRDTTIPVADQLYGWTTPAVADDGTVEIRYCPELLASTFVPDHPTTDLLIHFLVTLTAMIVQELALDPTGGDTAVDRAVSKAYEALDDVGENSESGVHLLYRHQFLTFVRYTTPEGT